jgi:glyoxylase-like metal-dependent hydrolase (beta-lactamase superfamily II)
LEIQAVINSLFSSVSYLLIDGNSAWIVDIGDADSIIQYINNNNLSLKGILLTHGHFDHIYGLNDIVASFPTVPVYTNEFDAQMLVCAKLNMSKYHETPFEFQYPENIVVLGSDLGIGSFQVYETPGTIQVV